MKLTCAWAMGLAGLLLVSCQSGKKTETSGGAGQTDFAAKEGIKLDGNAMTIAGIEFHPPSTWNDLGPSGMRKANYTFGPVEGEADSATMAVFYFGPSSGGGVKDNIERWIGQMTLPNQSDPHAAAAQRDLTVDGMAVHWMEISGTYQAPKGGMMSGETIEKPNYLMAAAVVEGPQGNLFFKLTGPDKTAAAMTDGFKALLLAAKNVGRASGATN